MGETPGPAPERQPIADIFLRRLNLENPQDLALARALDEQSFEAINPFAYEHPDPHAVAHTGMSEDELKRWMADRPTGMLRVIEVPAGEIGEKRAVGFVYLYNDSSNDTDFRARAQILREKQGLPSNRSVWEMNFWVVDGTGDAVVEEAVRQTLTEFAQSRGRETTTVMFVEAQDLREAYQEAVGKAVTLGDLKKPATKAVAENTFQDTRVLEQSGFIHSGRIAYEPGASPKDFAYTVNVRPGQAF